jgi:branched-chain amino acid transport system permease protein
VLARLAIGIPCLRLKGTYLALATLAFPIIVTGIIFAFPDVTGGELGLSGLERITHSRTADCYVCIIIMLVSCTIMWKISSSKLRIIFHAIREDELECECPRCKFRNHAARKVCRICEAQIHLPLN